MLSTGNVQNYLRKLQTELRSIKFRDVDFKSLQTGSLCELLKIYHHIFLNYNPLFAKTLLDKFRCDFYGKTDRRFVDTMYKALRDYFNYKPPITKEQVLLKENSKWHVMLLFLLDKNVQRSSNVFHPLYDMDLETTLLDEFSSIEQNHQDKLQSKSISSF